MILAACVCAQPKVLTVEVCTAENVSTALTLALKYIPEDDDGTEGSITVFTGSSSTIIGYHPDPADAKRKEAKRLLEEADALDQKKKDLEFIRKVAEACAP